MNMLNRLTFLTLLSFPIVGNAQTLRYQDESGNLHFVEKLSEIPAQYRGQVVAPTPLPYHNERERRAFERQRLIEEREKRREEVATPKSAKLANSKDLIGAARGDKSSSRGTSNEQLQMVDLFISPGCVECAQIEKQLKRAHVRYQKHDIVKSQKAFEMFDQLGAGNKVPVAKIGKTIVRGPNAEAIIAAATQAGKQKEEELSPLGTL